MAYEMVSLLRMLIDRDGSDLHLTVDNPPVGRVHGHLQYFGDNPLTSEDTLVQAGRLALGLPADEV